MLSFGKINTGETMKTQLTKEQSQHLIDLGVPKEKASIFRISCDVRVTGYRDEYLFTLQNLLEILPKYLEYKVDETIGAANFVTQWNNRFLHYEAGYDLYDMWNKSHYCAIELIDSLYELLCWTIENGYLKFD